MLSLSPQASTWRQDQMQQNHSPGSWRPQVGKHHQPVPGEGLGVTGLSQQRGGLWLQAEGACELHTLWQRSSAA